MEAFIVPLLKSGDPTDLTDLKYLNSKFFSCNVIWVLGIHQAPSASGVL